jgi:DNA replication protein DnaC
MLNEQTRDKLYHLKLYGLASAFTEYLEQPDRADLCFEERFGMMIDREWSGRQERHLKRRLKSAKLREQACIEDVDYRHPRQLDRSVIQRLASCDWIRNHEDLVITGATGLGKTWLADALANQACREGFSAYHVRVSRLLEELRVARADGSYVRELNRLAKTDVLLLDDWGLAPLNDEQRRDLLEIVQDRHGVRSTIITSQLPVKKWHDAVGDPTIADAIMDRLIHSAHRIELKGPSMRKKAEEPSD